MRDKKMLLIFAVAGFAIFLIGALIPGWKSELPFLWVLGGIACVIVASFMFMEEKFRYDSPQLVGPGHMASLLQLEPVDSCTTQDSVTGKIYEWLLFLHGGIKLFGFTGGGDRGCSVVRRDLILQMEGNHSSLIVCSVGIPHIMGARPGDPYHALSELPYDIYKMVQRHNFDPRGHVLLWADPIVDYKAQLRSMEQLNYKNLHGAANAQVLKLTEMNKNLLEKMTSLSETNVSVKRGYGMERFRTGSDDRDDQAPGSD